MVKPFIVGTFNSENSLVEGVKILRADGTALDAVKAATRSVELDPSDTRAPSVWVESPIFSAFRKWMPP